MKSSWRLCAAQRERRRNLAAAICLALTLSGLSACAEQNTQTAPSSPAPGPNRTPPAVTVVVTMIATPAPTATETPPATATPTYDPQHEFDQARRAAFNGDDQQAVALYQELLKRAGAANSNLALQASLELGRSQFDAGDMAGAIDTLELLAAQPISASLSADARILLGKARDASGDSSNAILDYTRALSNSASLAPYVHLWLGDAHLAANRPISAVVPYQQALAGAASSQQMYERREKLALAHQLSGQYDAALDQYDAILNTARIPAYRARILWESAQVLLTLGQKTAAFNRLRDIVYNAPNTPTAFNALKSLLDNGQPVDELQRGIIDYHNGAYTAARDAFKRAIQVDDRLNEVRYWAAQNYLKLGSTIDAFRNLDQIIAAGPGSARYADAILAKGDALSSQGNADEAAATYQLLPRLAPNDPQAPAALLRAGRAFDRVSKIEQAAQVYLAAQLAYPAASEVAPETLLRGAVDLYRLGRYGDAISATQQILAQYPASKLAPLAQLWLGKSLLTAGQISDGQASLRDLAGARPDEYEGARGAELLAGAASPLSQPFGSVAIEPDESAQAEADQAEAEQWLRARLGISDTVDIRRASPELQADARFQRGNALWRLGFKTEAREEFESLRADHSRDALATYQLALHLRDIGLYRSSIGAADTLMRLVPPGTVSGLPVFLARLLYPQYYADLVAKAASEFGVDPLLVFSIMRQESLFEPFAASSASAYGLMQVIPPTGQEIHGDLEWPDNYTDRDLTRPYVSARFGTYYLAKQRNYFDGDLYVALAAYNGGPGNSLIWKNRSGGDPDAFFMTVNFEETQRYLRAIAANYAIYHRLYEEHRTQSTEHRAQNTEHRTQITEHRLCSVLCALCSVFCALTTLLPSASPTCPRPGC